MPWWKRICALGSEGKGCGVKVDDFTGTVRRSYSQHLYLDFPAKTNILGSYTYQRFIRLQRSELARWADRGIVRRPPGGEVHIYITCSASSCASALSHPSGPDLCPYLAQTQTRLSPRAVTIPSSVKLNSNQQLPVRGIDRRRIQRPTPARRFPSSMCSVALVSGHVHHLGYPNIITVQNQYRYYVPETPWARQYIFLFDVMLVAVSQCRAERFCRNIQEHLCRTQVCATRMNSAWAA